MSQARKKTAKKPGSRKKTATTKPRIDRTPAGATTEEPPEAPADPLADETFWWVKWGPKVAAHDPERILLCVNGEPKHWARGVECIVPKRFLAAADDAKEDRFTQAAGKGYKKLQPRAKAPYEILYHLGDNGEATEEEYEEMLAKGTKTYTEFATAQAARPAD